MENFHKQIKVDIPVYNKWYSQAIQETKKNDRLVTYCKFTKVKDLPYYGYYTIIFDTSAIMAGFFSSVGIVCNRLTS